MVSFPSVPAKWKKRLSSVGAEAPRVDGGGAQLLELAFHQQLSFAENADVRGDPLDPLEVVGGEEDRRAAVGELADELVEDEAAGDRVEAEGRVVEEEELGLLGQGEGEHDQALLAAGELAEALVQRDAEAVEPAAEAGGVPAAVERADEAAEGVDLHRRRRIGRFRGGGDPAHEPMTRLPGVEAVELEDAAVGTPVAEQRFHQRALARAVPAQQGVDRALRDVQVEPVEGGRAAVAQRDVADQDLHDFFSWDSSARKASKRATAAGLASKPRPEAVMAKREAASARRA